MRTPFDDEIEAQNKKIEALIAEITAAFDGISREDGMTMHEAAEWDSQCQPGQWVERERAKDTEPCWQDVPEEWIGDNSVGAYTLAYIDAKGFRYYIPAFMIWALKTPVSSLDSNTDVVWNLLPNSPHRFALLNLEQSKAIAHFLELLAAPFEVEAEFFNGNDTAQEALNSYWGQFL